MAFAGVVRSPNIWDHPRVYELENLAADPDRLIEAAMLRLRDPRGGHVLDIGAGTGFHLPRLAELAGPTGRVTGIEPHRPLAAAARRRCAGLAGVRVLEGTAQALPLPDASVDVVHARWAYFFGPGCEPGLREMARVLRRGGAAFVIDNDTTRSTFGRWFARHLPEHDPVEVARFWARNGFTREPLTIRWVFQRRADLEAVLRIELRPEVAEAALAEHRSLEVDYAVNLFWRRV